MKRRNRTIAARLAGPAVSIAVSVMLLAATHASAATYSGNGSKQIGVIRVTSPSTLYWKNVSGRFDTGLFLIYDKEFRISVSSTASSGTSYVGPGTYRNITVAGDDWTFRITPNSAKASKPRPGFGVTLEEAKAETVKLMKLEHRDHFKISKKIGGKPSLTQFDRCKVISPRRQKCVYYTRTRSAKGCYITAAVTKALGSRKLVARREKVSGCGFGSLPSGSPTIT